MPPDIYDQIIELALEQCDLGPRELAWFTDEKRYFVLEATVYRLLNAHDLIASRAYVVIRHLLDRSMGPEPKTLNLPHWC